MPGENPKKQAEMTFRIMMTRGTRFRVRRLLTNRLIAGIALTGILPSSIAFAQDATAGKLLSRFFEASATTSIMMLAVFGGAMSFALLSASWLIRERKRITDENRVLKNSLSDFRARNDLIETLVDVSDQRTIVWNSAGEKPVVMGSLSPNSGMPEERATLLAFGRWLEPDSAARFESSLARLRGEAVHFDLNVKTRAGQIFEAKGRTSGSSAFVRFRELEGERAKHAKLKLEHDDLLGTFKTMQALFEKLPMPFWLSNRQGQLSWANPAYLAAVESQSVDAAMEANCQLLDREHLREMANAHEDEGYFEGVRPVVVAGDRKMLEVYSASSDDGIAAIAADQSEIEAMRGRLTETVEGHSRMLDHLATAVAIFDKRQRLIFFNSEFQKLWKLDTAQLENEPTNGELLNAMRDQKMLPDQPDWRKWRDQQLEIYTALEPSEEWWHLPDGQTLRVVVTPRNEGGATWIFENVTERLELESNYNALMQIQGETLDHLGEAVAVFGSDGKLKLFNPALTDVWRLDGVEIKEGTHINAVIECWNALISNPDELETIVGEIAGLSDERNDMSGRLEMVDGKTFQYSVVALPKGQSMLTLSDITASVQFENALRERAEALEESDRLKSRFIQHVSYELRAPLTNISGFGEMLGTAGIGPLNEKQSEYLQHINYSADVLRALVDDILDLASIDAGTMVLDQAEMELEPVVASTLSGFETQFAAKGLKAETRIDETSAQMIADRERVEQILGNLVSNAINASPDGGTIKVEAELANGNHVLSVSDEGTGVAEELQETIFNRFEAVSAGGQRQGAGLGLSIVKGFVELHGGRVFVENVEGRGARFVCSFPQFPQSDGQSEKGAEDPVVKIAAA